MLKDWMIPDDLARGDLKSPDRDWSDVTLHRIESVDDPLFDMAFGALWAEFGAAREVEQAGVLAKRLRWEGHEMKDGWALRYRLMLITSGGKFAAVRDHTAIVRENVPGAVVHMSHNLVAVDWRRTGLAGWLRALPIQTARRCLEIQRRPPDSPITLIGEMEHPDPTHCASEIRLRAYERSGWLKIDPSRIHYMQPDFRAPGEIDLDGRTRPLPLSLIVRRVGRESETVITGREVRNLVESLYHMYGRGFRPSDMAPVYRSLEACPGPDERIALVAPTHIAS